MTEPTSKNNKSPSNKLSDFGLLSHLFFSLNYHHVMIPKSGLLNKWKKKTIPLDIDVSCILYDKDGKHLDLIWFKKLRDDSESIRHYGDQLHGHKTIEEKREHRAAKEVHRPEHSATAQQKHELSPTDLETIHINLFQLPREVYHIALIVTSTPNYRLSKVPIGEVELQDIEGNTGMRVDLTLLPKDCKHLWLGSLVRVNADSFYEDNNPKNTKHFWRLLQKQQPLHTSKNNKSLSEIMNQFVGECADF